LPLSGVGPLNRANIVGWPGLLVVTNVMDVTPHLLRASALAVINVGVGVSIRPYSKCFGTLGQHTDARQFKVHATVLFCRVGRAAYGDAGRSAERRRVWL
jgi:hypothetical protein